ncbi:hypothetical protein ACFWA9_19445 [Kitasatospora sp. NPDC059973]|uniref:hypothetical protein n=1 Tax=Kitasatospora sp. NPDC059973 TaxID=3347020 RepID=UPI0036AD814F
MTDTSGSRYRYESNETKKLRLRADAFRYSPAHERLAEMKRDRPEQYDQVSPLMRISLAHYEADKAAAVQLGRNVSAPTNQEV